MPCLKKIFLASLIFTSILFAQNSITLATYNLLNYSSDTTRNKYFRAVLKEVNPDLIAVQEIISQSGINNFLNNVLNHNGNEYSAGVFINGTGTDNGLYYKSSEFENKYEMTLLNEDRVKFRGDPVTRLGVALAWRF